MNDSGKALPDLETEFLQLDEVMDGPEENEESRHPNSLYLTIGLVLGLGLGLGVGAALGAWLGHRDMWVGLGIPFGIVFGLVLAGGISELVERRRE